MLSVSSCKSTGVFETLPNKTLVLVYSTDKGVAYVGCEIGRRSMATLHLHVPKIHKTREFIIQLYNAGMQEVQEYLAEEEGITMLIATCSMADGSTSRFLQDAGFDCNILGVKEV